MCPLQGVVQLGITLSEETEDHIQVRRREVHGKLNCHLLYTTTAVLSIIIALPLPSSFTYTCSLAHIYGNTHTQAAAAWALGQIGRHSPEHAKAVAQANVLPRLLQLYLGTGSSEDLQAKVRESELHGLGVGRSNASAIIDPDRQAYWHSIVSTVSESSSLLGSLWA